MRASRTRSYHAVKMLVLGFSMGVTVHYFLSLVSSTDQQLRRISNDYDQVVNAMPINHQTACDCGNKERDVLSPETDSNGAVEREDGGDKGMVLSLKVPEESDLVDRGMEGLPGDFDPDTSAVIVTKIQGPKTMGPLKQSLCLLNYAYNNRVHYDIVVFTAMPIPEHRVKDLEAAVAPANLTIVQDNPGLHEMVEALSEPQRKHLLDRCKVNVISELTWTTKCEEKSSSGTTIMPMQYNWQAEFRSLHIWTQPILAKYKYMLWLDSDGLCTKRWEQDPIATAKRNNLALLFDNFPAGRSNGDEWVNRTTAAFGRNICAINRLNGTLDAVSGRCTHAKYLSQIYGFFYIVDLDFYRSTPVMKWLKIMIGDSKFSRKYDDQIAVTMPAAVLAGNRSWDMRYFGLNMGVLHNNRMDGQKTEKVGHFDRFWKAYGEQRFPEAFGKCKVVTDG